MGEAVLSAFLQVFFDRLPLEEYVRDFIRGCNIEKEVVKLGRTLRNVTSFLNDAENKQYQKKPVKEWLDNLRDAVYDAEDLIDHVTTEALRQKLKSESQTSSSQVSRFFLPISKIKNVKKFKKIKAITQRFEELERERSRLGLEEIASGSSSSNVFRETSSVVDESSIVGREDDKANIIDLLLKKESTSIDNGFCIIPIVGMGGMGKTTLAQIVYNDTRVENCFDVKAWVCVSDEFDIKRITKAILKSVPSTPSDSKDDLNSLQVGLKDALSGKKFLIVLDDVWNKNYDDWDLLQKPFGVGAPGSAFIVTTRDGDIGSIMGAVNNYPLKKLSVDDCWSVFVRHAFGKRTTGNVDANPNLAEIGMEIVKKCNGLPLAAKSLGGLLRSKEESIWQNVLNSKIWELTEDAKGILPVLKLSYYYLPSHLKRCFAYCSIFPKDYEFEEDNLVLLWMAEGFLQQPNGNMELEDFGHMCFRELLSRSFFQPSTSVNQRFVMHDLMNDLALWAAGETCFRPECENSRKARHSSYITGQYDGIRKFKAYYEVDCLRTFLPLKGEIYIFGPYLTRNVTFDLLPKLKFLRVLSFGKYNGITELPGSIGDLKHLRYLDLSQTQIKSLPESVCTLYNLQTLLLKDCRMLKKLPEDLQNLINLRHLSLADSIEQMPRRVGRLTSLRGLSDFVVGEDSTGKGIGELMNLKHLQGLLRISKLENVVNAQQAREANLCDKKGLNVLKMEWCFKFEERRYATAEKEVLDKLRPHKNLKELTIKCYGGISFPTWIGDPYFTNMVILKLEGCERCTDLPPLGKLSMLKDLFIGGMNGVVYVGTGFYGEGCSNPFPSLETLCFQDMPEWAEWLPSDVEKHDNLFARLRELSLMQCPKLSGSIPDHLPFLEKLKVHHCERLTVSISKLPKLCKLDIRECKEVVQQRMAVDDMSLLKSVALKNIAKVTFLTDGFIQGSTAVEDLEIDRCDELVSLWQKEKNVSLLQHLTLLHKLVIRGCKNLENLEGLQNLTSLRELRIVGCPLLVSLPERGLTLQKLEIKDCQALKSVSEAISWHNCNNSSLEVLNIFTCDSLTSIARASLFSTVKQMWIESCSNLQSLLNEDDDDDDEASSSSSSLPSLLETLNIEDCTSLTSLFSSSRGESSTPPTLKRLEIWNCPKLESIGEFNLQDNNTSLESIEIYSCESLKSLPKNLHNLTRLSDFRIENCKSLVRFPDGGLPAANLKILRIHGCEKLEALPDRMHDLTSLEELEIRDCPGIVVVSSFPQQEEEEVCFPIPTNNNIKSLTIEGPTSNIWKQLLLERRWGGLNRLTSLTSLDIHGGSSSLDIVSFPADKEESSGSSSRMMVLPSSLINLWIVDFPNLERLSSKGFQNLTSLEHLYISRCPKLQSFPKKGLFPSLLYLFIENCPLLSQRCKRDQGKEWPKISHVPCIQIDYFDI